MQKFRLIWVGAALAFLALLAVVLCAGRTPVSPPLPNPNGYDDLVQAGEAVQGDPGNYSNLDHDGLGALVCHERPPLGRLRLGLSRPCCLPMNSSLTNGGIAQLAQIKRLARLLAAEGRLREMNNQPAEAGRSYLDTMRLGDQASRGGLLITRLVGIACEAIGYAGLARVTPRLGAADARAFVAELEKLDANRTPWAEFLVNERRFHRFQNIRPATHPIQWAMGWWQSRSSLARAESRQKLAVAHERLLDHGTGLARLPR